MANLGATTAACATMAFTFGGSALMMARWLRRCSLTTVSTLTDLSTFTLEEILIEGELSVLLGRFSWQPAGERALVKLSARKVSLEAGLLPSLTCDLSSYSGAEYAYYVGRSALLSLLGRPALRPAYNVEVIAPASEKQIDRARPQPGCMITETAELYAAVVEPYIAGLDPRATSWIYKCLDLSKEAERVLFNDPDPSTGFLLNVDTKWKSHPLCTTDAAARATWRGHESVRDLYCLAIVHRRDLRSLRDLRGSHLQLLRRILEEGVATLCGIYGVGADELRVFVHYQPQFYHLHVHFTRLHNDLGCQVERAHLLHDVIAQIEADPNAFAKRTLYYQLKTNDKLYAMIRAHQADAATDPEPPCPVAGADTSTRRRTSPARARSTPT